jgi:hypothetical protein
VTSPSAASMRDTKDGSSSIDFMICDDEAQPEKSRVQSKLSESERCIVQLTNTTFSYNSGGIGSLAWRVQFINPPSKHHTFLQQGSFGL